MKIALLTLLMLSLGGCQTKSLYYWGDYSHTAYQYQSEPNEVTRLEHREEMLSIVETSNNKNMTVAPGIYAELGMLAAENSDTEQAIAYYQFEAAAFPEAKHLMAFLISQIEGEKDD